MIFTRYISIKLTFRQTSLLGVFARINRDFKSIEGRACDVFPLQVNGTFQQRVRVDTEPIRTSQLWTTFDLETAPNVPHLLVNCLITLGLLVRALWNDTIIISYPLLGNIRDSSTRVSLVRPCPSTLLGNCFSPISNGY